MKIDMTEVQNQKTALSTSQTSLSNQIETAKSSLVNLVNSESLKGDVKSAINAKISNHQIPLLTNFSNAMSVLSAQYDKTIEQFQATVSETAADAIIDTDYLQGILDGFSGLETNIASVDRETASIYSSISDIISLTNPDVSTITTPLSEGKTILTDTKTNMESFNGWKRGDEFNTVLQSQTQTLGSLSNMGQLSFTDREARAFYNSEDFLNAVKTVSSKAEGSTPVELLELVSKTINKALGKWKKWSAYDQIVDLYNAYAELPEGEVAQRLLQLFSLNPSSITSAILKSDGLWDLLATIESKGPKGFKFVSKVLDLMVKYESKAKYFKFVDKAVEVAQDATSLAGWGAKALLKKLSGIKYLENAVETGKNFVGNAKFLGKGIKYIGKLGTVFTFAELGITGISSAVSEYSKTGSIGKAAKRAAVDVVSSVGPLEGATIGGAVGGPVGAGIGLAVGAVIQGVKFIEPNFFNDPVQGTKNIVNKVGNGIKGAANAVSNGIGKIGKALGFG